MTRKIIHCDADCFFAAIEMRDDPSLQTIPMAIGGSPDRRGVIATCNYPARQYGIHSAMPSRTALKQCPNLLILPGNMEKYRQASRQMRDIFYDYTDQVEPLSLDEAYLDVSACKQFDGSATLIAREIRQRIKEAVGITVSAGVGRSKFIAKIASDWKKPDGLFVVTPDREAEFVARLPVEKIPGVGKVTAKKLHDMGIETCLDLQSHAEEILIKRFGIFGSRLYQLCRGQDEREVKPFRIRKSLSVEKTFARDLVSLSECRIQMDELFQRFCTRLTASSKPAHVTKVFIKIKFDDFTQTTLETVAHSPRFTTFQQLLDDGFQRHQRPVRLLGLGVRFATPDNDEAMVQLDLPCLEPTTDSGLSSAQ